MEVERGIDPQWGRLGRGVGTWLLGRGLLSLHAGVYLLAATGLILVNLVRAPNDLWVEAPLRRWGAVVLVHAGLVAGGWTYWHVSRWSRRRSAEGSALHAADDGAVPAGTGGRFSRYRLGETSTPGGDGAGSLSARLRTSVAKVTERVQTAGVDAQVSRLPDLWRRRSALLAAGLTRVTALAERGRSSAETRLHRARGQQPDASWPTQPQWPAAPDYEQSSTEWPSLLDDRAHASDMADEVAVAPFTAHGPPPASSFSTHTPPALAADAAANEATPETEQAAAPTDRAKPDGGWSWVETAAATWLARREADTAEDGNRPASASSRWSEGASSRRPLDQDAERDPMRPE